MHFYFKKKKKTGLPNVHPIIEKHRILYEDTTAPYFPNLTYLFLKWKAFWKQSILKQYLIQSTESLSAVRPRQKNTFFPLKWKERTQWSKNEALTVPCTFVFAALNYGSVMVEKEM